jgi:hypothetical protein
LRGVKLPEVRRVSTKLAAVPLNASVAKSPERRAAYRFAETANDVSVVQEAADTPSHFVAEGNLTAD